jgi:hypothetical protein
MSSVQKPTMTDVTESFRVEQMELHEWLKRERVDETLTPYSVDYILNKLLMAGFGGVECIKKASHAELLKIGLTIEQINWLKRMIPANITLLEGKWVDDSCMQIYNIVANKHGPSFNVYCNLLLYCTIEYSYTDDTRILLIIKNYNNSTVTKYWDGIILDNFTRIAWVGRNKWGDSTWVKLSN